MVILIAECIAVIASYDRSESSAGLREESAEANWFF